MTALAPPPGAPRWVKVTAADGTEVLLGRSGGLSYASGSTIAYTVSVTDRWIGWVYDERPWLGDRFGGRRWSACWREVGDSHSRWRTQGFHTRQMAVDALLEHVRGSQP